MAVARVEALEQRVGAADQRQSQQQREEGQPEQDRPGDVQSAGPSRRIPATRRRPAEQERDEPRRHVDEEHPAPGRREQVLRRSRQPRGRDRFGRVEGAQDGGPHERARGHPEERECADHAEGASARRPVVQMGCRSGPDGDEDPAAGRLHQAGGDQLVHGLGQSGEERSEREHGEGRQQWASCPPQVRQAAREGHRQHVDEQVAVDDPARLAQLHPCGPCGRVREILEDRRQGDGRDHQFEPAQEHADAEDREHDERGPAIHAAECSGAVAAACYGAGTAPRSVATPTTRRTSSCVAPRQIRPALSWDGPAD